jgi:alkylated DNA repair dioxygenase AlkB
MTDGLYLNILPEGLKVLTDFVSSAEENAITELLSGFDPDLSLKRRTWHFGRRYDYQFGRISKESDVLGIPQLMRDIGFRLVKESVLQSEPDQVIVNEYLVSSDRNDGISQHRDRTDCFGPVVVTVSLLESWKMKFSRMHGESLEVLLPRLSAAVMSGPSRYEWSHGIQPRRYEKTGGLKSLRQRRLSLTFRTVNEGF